MPSEGGYLEAEGLEKTWRIRQETIAHEVDISSSRKQYDIILPGTINEFFFFHFHLFNMSVLISSLVTYLYHYIL